MIDFLATFLTHPFVVGMIFGGIGFGGSLGIIGWCLGYEHAMRKVGEWMRPLQSLPKLDPIHGDVPNLPPVRDRRFSPLQHREWTS